MKLVSVDQMLSIEREADAAGLPYDQMMQNAGAGLAAVIENLDPAPMVRSVTALVGPGNNGGDTLIALSILAESGWNSSAYVVRRVDDALVSRARQAGARVVASSDDRDFSGLASLLDSGAVLLDGLLGTGTKLPLRGEIPTIMREVNRLLGGMPGRPYVIAVDCPSGADCDTGEVAGDCIAADLTVTMAAVKQGLLRLPAFEYLGDLRVVDIGLPPDLPSLRGAQADVADARQVSGLIPRRSPVSHKGTFGTVVVAAGSASYTGAALLAGVAAYRVGAGLVRLAVPSVLHSSLAGFLPEATWLLLPHEGGAISQEASQVLLDALPSSTALLMGPGLGTQPTTQEFLAQVLARAAGGSKAIDGAAAHATSLPPVVVDADGLKLLARIPDWAARLPAPAVLTPHPGEMSVLTGIPKDQIQADRSAVAARFAEAWGHVVVLKGAFTVIAAPGGSTTVIPVASAALARAGTGDVLAGIIVGLLGQGVGPFDSAVAGAWIHAQAGLQAARELGNEASVLAGDLLDTMAPVMSALRRN